MGVSTKNRSLTHHFKLTETTQLLSFMNRNDMKRFILLFLIIPLLNYGQSWEKTFGGPGYDVGYSVLQTTDGGYVITGSIIADSLLNTQSVFLLKTDSNGDSLWTKT